MASTASPGARRARRARRRRRAATARRAGLVGGQLVLLLAAPLLAWVGFRAVLDTTDGRTVDPELDPDETGYEALVEPTPVLGLLGRADDGSLSWAAVLALSGGEGGGGALFLVPVATLVPTLGDVERTLTEVDGAGGTEAAGPALGEILGVGLTEVAEVAPARLAQLVAPVAPLSLRNPDAVGAFAAGELALAPEDVPAYLGAAGDDESDLTRLARHEVFWRAWLAAVGAAAPGDPDVVPGESARGLGRFVRGLAAGPVTVDVPPVAPETRPDGSTAYRRDGYATIDLAESRIPFPVASQPGARVRVRVLDGVGVPGLSLRAARDAVLAGGQVVIVGNADRFDAATTRVVYFEPAVAEAAAAIAEAFGVEAEQHEGPNPDDRVDVAVVAGRDLALTYGRAVPPTSTAHG